MSGKLDQLADQCGLPRGKVNRGVVSSFFAGMRDNQFVHFTHDNKAHLDGIFSLEDLQILIETLELKK